MEVSDVFRSEGLPEVALTVLVPPDARATAPDVLAAAKATLEHGGRHWLPYPYPHLTLVAPPVGANADVGRDGVPDVRHRLCADRSGRAARRAPLGGDGPRGRRTTGGRGWWPRTSSRRRGSTRASTPGPRPRCSTPPGSAGTFAQFAPPGTRLARSRRSSARPSRTVGSGPSRPVPRFESSIVRPGWRFKGGNEVGRSTYGRAAGPSRMLEREVGPETFARIMRTYAERWAFRHPGTDDFLARRLRGLGQGPPTARDRALSRHRRSGRRGGRPPLQAGVALRRARASTTSMAGHRPSGPQPRRGRRRRGRPVRGARRAARRLRVAARRPAHLPGRHAPAPRQIPPGELWNRVTTQRRSPAAG